MNLTPCRCRSCNSQSKIGDTNIDTPIEQMKSTDDQTTEAPYYYTGDLCFECYTYELLVETEFAMVFEASNKPARRDDDGEACAIELSGDGQGRGRVLRGRVRGTKPPIGLSCGRPLWLPPEDEKSLIAEIRSHPRTPSEWEPPPRQEGDGVRQEPLGIAI